MSMSIGLGSKIENDLYFMAQFAEKMGITIEVDYSLNYHCLSFTIADYGKDENSLEDFIIQLDEKNDRATVKRKTRHEYDFEIVGDHPITSYRDILLQLVNL